jgi:hypothetical protein
LNANAREGVSEMGNAVIDSVTTAAAVLPQQPASGDAVDAGAAAGPPRGRTRRPAV